MGPETDKLGCRIPKVVSDQRVENMGEKTRLLVRIGIRLTKSGDEPAPCSIQYVLGK